MELKKNFHSEVIEPCAASVRDAVANDEYVEVEMQVSGRHILFHYQLSYFCVG